MRNLILIRHVKSSWGNPDLADFDRPIKKSRSADAETVAQQLKHHGIAPDMIMSSPALRTRQTTALLCAAFRYDPEAVQYDAELYECSEREVMQAIRMTPSYVHTLFIIGHNPALTATANLLTGNQAGDLPTSGTAWIALNTPDWNIYSGQFGKLMKVFRPKEIRD